MVQPGVAPGVRPAQPARRGPADRGASPWTPAAWAETPIHTIPSRIITLCAASQSGAVSKPAETLSHSTITAPDARAGSCGRWTTMRVVNGADASGVARHRPSVESGTSDVNERAVPLTKYSCCS